MGTLSPIQYWQWWRTNFKFILLTHACLIPTQVNLWALEWVHWCLDSALYANLNTEHQMLSSKAKSCASFCALLPTEQSLDCILPSTQLAESIGCRSFCSVVGSPWWVQFWSLRSRLCFFSFFQVGRTCYHIAWSGEGVTLTTLFFSSYTEARHWHLSVASWARIKVCNEIAKYWFFLKYDLSTYLFALHLSSCCPQVFLWIMPSSSGPKRSSILNSGS